MINKRLIVTSKLTQNIQEGSDVMNHFFLTAEACSQLTNYLICFYDVDCIATVVVITERCAASMRRYDVTFNHCDVSKTFVMKQFVFLASCGKSNIIMNTLKNLIKKISQSSIIQWIKAPNWHVMIPIGA